MTEGWSKVNLNLEKDMRKQTHFVPNCIKEVWLNLLR